MSSPLLLRHRLPDEITLKILDFWIGIPHIRTEVRGQVECSRPRCPKSTRRNRKLLEGTPWAHEFDRTLTLMPKYFDEQLDLIATHMVKHSTVKVPEASIVNHYLGGIPRKMSQILLHSSLL
jgi:hypothetical protein